MLAEKRRPKAVVGSAKPRLAPPTPARADLDAFIAEAQCMGIVFMPWQEVAGRYLYAVGSGDAWLYPEVADIVARQNGKTEILKPHIVRRLLMGRRIMHTAQNRELPREVFGAVAEHMISHHSDKLAKSPRFANGQEEIVMIGGGRYRIVAPTRGGARGPSNDDLIIDEIRELVDHDFIAAAKPTLSASANPQTLYLSNAGSDESAVLNALRERADKDPALAYLEWSAAPERSAVDLEGWREANPAIGHLNGKLDNLEREYRANQLGGTMSVFETEYLCRWVRTMREPLVDIGAWNLCAADAIPPGKRPVMAVSLDPAGTGAAAALSWQRPDGYVALRLLLRATGSPIDVSALGADLRDLAAKHRVARVAFDPMTDAELAKHFTTSEPVGGLKFANASAQFVNLITAGKLRHVGCAAVGDDLTWTARKAHEETGRFSAVRANDDHPIPAVLAAIRAVWLSSGPRPARPRIY